MTTILTSSPAAAEVIARIVGAHGKHPDFYEGEEYCITWTAGRIVNLAPPAAYGYGKLTSKVLPLLPETFLFAIRPQRNGQGGTADSAAARQLHTIGEIFARCQSIIAATDASGEGELTFRWIYTYLGCGKPFRRLWLTSLTDEAIREGLAHLHDGHDFDALYEAADCRAKADWLVAVNASQALANASGLGNNALGRILMPTLAMICARYRGNREFTPAAYWQLGITLRRDDRLRKFRCIERIGRQKTADERYKRVAQCGQARITIVDRRRSYQTQPLPYDLTALLKECCRNLEYPAKETLAAVRSLYEKRLITYPSTGSRHIPEKIFARMPELLARIFRQEEFSALQGLVDPKRLARHCVDDSKVSVHHAMIPTGEAPAAELPEVERMIYRMIVLRTIEAFAPRCEKEVSLVEATADGLGFRSRELRILRPGWRAVRSREEDREEGETDDISIGDFRQGEIIPIDGLNLGKAHTVPRPFYTEETLLTAMETAGRDLSGTKRKNPDTAGLGLPETRAAIIPALLEREYIEYSGRSIIPTERGLYLYDTVLGMQIADVAMAESWEKALAQVERHGMSVEGFMQSFAIFTRQATEEIAALRFTPDDMTLTCPKCGTGRIIIRRRVVKCSNARCGLVVIRSIFGKDLTDEHVGQLFTAGQTSRIAGLRNRAGRAFEAALTFDGEFRLKCVQPVFGTKE